MGWVLMPECCLTGDHPPAECPQPWFGPLEERAAAEEMSATMSGYVVVPFRERDFAH
jgi:hypothetical protein